VEPGCRIEMLGTLCLVVAGQRIERFRTQKTASLLAYLAYYRRRSHPREELIEHFWPGLPLPAGRDSLSTALSALRRQLEPAGVPQGSVLLADRWSVRLDSEKVTTDAEEFERLLDEALPQTPAEERRFPLQQALALYKGDLLPGFYEDWVVREQVRLGERYTEALQQLTLILEEAGDWEAALDTAHRAIATDPYNEVSYRARMRLCAALGRPTVALEAFQELELRLKTELGVAPTLETRRLADLLRRDPTAVTARKSVANPPKAPHALARNPTAKTGTQAPAFPPTLPLQLTRFFGREQETRLLERWLLPLDNPLPKRLITLTGPGGAGKTRLAVEAARHLSDAYGGRVVFVSLAGVTAPFLLPYTVAHALQLPPTPQNEALDPIVVALDAAPSLLILDNFEHLLQAPPVAEYDPPKTGSAALFVRLLLERIPGLTCLVTSREILRLSGEQELMVTPLPLPASSDDLESLLACESVALYADRAQAVQADFAVTARNAGEVAEICRRLEGLPLAIEIAAAWVRMLAPAQMLLRLDNRLNLPASHLRDLPSRHRSLRATIEWSYDLLPPHLQTFFAQLSVFRDGWTLEAAESVCQILTTGREGERQTASLSCLQALSELRERSLVVMEAGEDDARFRLLETLREFATEKLEETGQREPTHQRHAVFYAALARQADLEARMPENVKALQPLEREQENLRAALDWYSLHPHEADAYLAFCIALYPFWNWHGQLAEGRKYLSEALSAARGRVSEPALREGLYAAGALAVDQSDYDRAQALLEESLALSRSTEDPAGSAAALLYLGTIAHHRGDLPQAAELLEEGLALSQGLQKPWLTASLLIRLGILARNQRDFERAQALLEEALALSRRLDDKRNIAVALTNLGLVLRGLKMSERAVPLLEESLTLLRVQADKPALSLVLGNLGVLAHDQNDFDRAEGYYREALALDYERGNRRSIALSLTNLANAAHQKQQWERSTYLCMASEAMFESMGIPRIPEDLRTMQKRLADLETKMGKDAYDTACAMGRALTLEQAIALALSEDPTTHPIQEQEGA